MSSINKMAGGRSWCGGFQDKSFAFQDWKYADKRQKWKEKVQKNAQFPFCGQTKAFRYEIVFRGIQPCFYTADRSAWLVLNQPRQRGFWRHLRYIPYSMIKEECSFSKRIFEFIKVSWTFSTFWHRHERKTTKCAFEIFFFAMCSTDLTCVNATI